MDNNTNRITLKLAVLGDPFVGKTSLINKFMGKDFSKRYQKTFGSDISFKHIDKKDSNNIIYKISYSIWDIYGEATYEELTKQFLLGSQAIIIIYDVTNHVSFDNVLKWVKTADKSLNLNKVIVVLVANKIDLRSDTPSSLIWEDENSLFVKLTKEYSLNTEYFHLIETSAKEGTNVNEVFELISKTLIDHFLD